MSKKKTIVEVREEIAATEKKTEQFGNLIAEKNGSTVSWRVKREPVALFQESIIKYF